MSSKIISYYDWSLGFKGNTDRTSKITLTKKKRLNSIGIADDDFKTYLRKWKNTNLS